MASLSVGGSPLSSTLASYFCKLACLEQGTNLVCVTATSQVLSCVVLLHKMLWAGACFSTPHPVTMRCGARAKQHSGAQTAH